VGGDVYYNHKSGIEFSAGGRFINFATKDVKSITNSLGYYTGNYYFSLRSYITPESDNLTNVSGNLLVRKYLKDAKNYMGVNAGVGFSPELRQFTSGDQLLAETLLYIESQRLSFEYQFTSKNNLSAYRTNVGVLRQEQSFDPGTYFYSISAGLTYEFNF
jgi:YaiO family outer membrane protein